MEPIAPENLSRKEKNKIYQKRYRESEKGKENQRRYRQSEKGKACLRKNSIKHRLKRKYNLSLEEYSEKLIRQGGFCAICECSETAKQDGKLKRLAVDHNHETGRVRGLLCARCNRALGFVQENIKTLLSCVAYLYMWDADFPETKDEAVARIIKDITE